VRNDVNSDDDRGTRPDDTAVLAPVTDPPGAAAPSNGAHPDDGRADGDPDQEQGRADVDDGLAAALAAAAPGRWWNRGTVVLGAVLLLLGGFLAGVQVQQTWGHTTGAKSRTGAGQQAGRAGGPRGGFPTGAAGVPGAASAPRSTTGTVKLIDGTTVYLQTADGTVVTVRTGGDTVVSTARAGSLKDLEAGDTVSVQGGVGADGTVTATNLTARKPT
jgi:hypothetical protein